MTPLRNLIIVKLPSGTLSGPKPNITKEQAIVKDIMKDFNGNLLIVLEKFNDLEWSSHIHAKDKTSKILDVLLKNKRKFIGKNLVEVEDTDLETIDN